MNVTIYKRSNRTKGKLQFEASVWIGLSLLSGFQHCRHRLRAGVTRLSQYI